MQAKYFLQRKNPTKKRYNKHLKICLNCGNTEVQEYESEISCEPCGSSYYFGKIDVGGKR